ncbi:hypothetical protein QAD02_003067 [Eretmocerus hayati]|uniref:Uncharacterized protein n=1 Tax=Eretmocerus hayati TaxID=131215 RepID=A0ACC2NLX5_9HYME|nr:hypothetical protein QAD02_003067 [Eretmocerus hayati]
MAPQNAPVQPARGGLPEDEPKVSSYPDLACQGVDLPGLGSDDDWDTMETYEEERWDYSADDYLADLREYVGIKEILAQQSNLDPVHTCVALPKPAGSYDPLYEPNQKKRWNDRFNPHLRKTRDLQWERRPKIKSAAARKCAPNPMIAEQVIAVINTTAPVEGAPSQTKEVQQEEENDGNERDAMVDESVQNDSVEAESVEDESVYWRKPTRPQPPRLYAVRPTTALGAPPVDEERQRLESRLQEEMAERVRRRQEAQYYRLHIDALRSKKIKQHGRKSGKSSKKSRRSRIRLGQILKMRRSPIKARSLLSRRMKRVLRK